MPVPIADNVYWVGAVDWEVRSFHGYTYHTHRGTSYNAYLIVDDKIALVDTVMAGFEDELLRVATAWSFPSFPRKRESTRPEGREQRTGNL